MYTSSSSSTSYSTFGSFPSSPTRLLDGLVTPNKQGNKQAEDEWTKFLSSSVAALAQTAMNQSLSEEDELSDSKCQEERTDERSNSSVDYNLDSDNQTDLGENGRQRPWESCLKSPTKKLTPATSKVRSYSTDSFSIASQAMISEAHQWRPLGHRSIKLPNYANENQSQMDFAKMELMQSASSNQNVKKTRARTASFRDVVTSCFDSPVPVGTDSEMFLNREIKVDGGKEDTSDQSKNKLDDLYISPSIIDDNRDYTASCMSMLTSLPHEDKESPVNFRNGIGNATNLESADHDQIASLSSVANDGKKTPSDSGNEGSAASLYHVKSPVLGTQTWQIQDEEFAGSPHFRNSARRRIASSDNIIPTYEHAGTFSNNLRSASSNQSGHEVNEVGRNNRDKDARAASVDFTFQLPREVSAPPLPPLEEPNHRMRAKSFSFSIPHHPNAACHDRINGRRDQTWMGYSKPFNGRVRPAMHDYNGPNVLRSNGSSHSQSHPVHPLPPQPPNMHPAHYHPPREQESFLPDIGCLSIDAPPPSQPHSYHSGPMYAQYRLQGSLRRYSGEGFPVVSYPLEGDTSLMHSNNAVRRQNTFGMNSMNYQTNQQNELRIFPPPPPVEPHIMMMSSTHPGYDWPRNNNDVHPSPPLPRTAQSTYSSVGMSFSQPEAQYEVEFKRGRQEIFAGNRNLNTGDYVKVEADRGEDIGRIVKQLSDVSKNHGMEEGGTVKMNEDDAVLMQPKRLDTYLKRIICLATEREIELLLEQRREESEVFEVCRSKVRQRLLPMNVIDAEYQFDRHKLTFFFEAERRIDFRELVRDLFAIYKTRIWLQQVVSNCKKMENAGLESIN